MELMWAEIDEDQVKVEADHTVGEFLAEKAEPGLVVTPQLQQPMLAVVAPESRRTNI